ncbi:hypothetical protein E2562_006118 [Oryza meyeriana var. granulata]|uniref:Uncharacterized protein n=1 Tax=Oryza meyeriana var. granulata TaxID=110450 RepID=A0A6G1EVQ7_9ORYZ|nr:hypothetical protein E2562_006118 [Oryza meyeriana var. granulata]
MGTPSRPGSPEIASLVNPRAVESSVEEALMPAVAYTADQSPFCDDLREFNSLVWLEIVEEAGYDVADLPPAYIILYPDILAKGWGWQRLVPYSPNSVQWPDFKRYLENYFTENRGKVAALCAQHKPEPVGQGVAYEYNELCAAANMCIGMESKLLRTSFRVLTLEEICLSTLIKDRARQLIQSKDESPAATAGLVCIAKEAELMFKLLRCEFDTTELVELSNKVRRSASNLMLYKDSEFATAAAGAMLGMAEEAMSFGRLLSPYDDDMEYSMCDEIREQTAKLFTKLEEEFACKAADNADTVSTSAGGTSEKPIGDKFKEVGGLEESKEKRKLNKIGNKTKVEM